jgi:hypothetical protein
VLYESRDFEPVEADAWLSPSVDLTPSTADGVLKAAQVQLGYVQQGVPNATGETLAIARVGPNGIAQTRVPLLLVGERAPRPVSLKASAADSPAHMAAAHRAAEADRMRRYWGLG